MSESKLKSRVEKNLDILFVALNPPAQSNANGHYFSGSGSRFFKLLFRSGLITTEIDKSFADEIVFGSNKINFMNKEYGITDLVFDVIETKSTKVKPEQHHVERLYKIIMENSPRFVCIIHNKVLKSFNRYSKLYLSDKLNWGNCGEAFRDCSSIIFCNYFPNGSNIPDPPKLKIFGELKSLL